MNVELVLVGGELVRVSCPAKYSDEFLQALDVARKRGDWLPAGIYEGLRFEYLGLSLDRINTLLIVGVLA
jgi:hypothetical protein